MDQGVAAGMVRRVLMIAFHYPPQKGSSGIQRTLKFSKYLPEFGWIPTVLSADPRAYESTSVDQLKDIPAEVVVERAFALDASRHLAIRRRYLRMTSLPDRWVSWWLGAVPAGLRLIRKYRPDVIWSTYPISTAHLIGGTLHRLSGIPWVADFRDPMIDDSHPRDCRTRLVVRAIERRTLRHCTKAVFTSPGAMRDYQARYSYKPESDFCLIENGYDEENFASALEDARKPRTGGKQFRLLHSGVIYPLERDPRPLFEALGVMLAKGMISEENFRLVLRAAHHEQYLSALARACGIDRIVDMPGPIPYREALAEMHDADGLLILQGASCNSQIPAKLYEYLRARRPILGLTDPAGDTAATLRRVGIDAIAPLDSREAIMAALASFLERGRVNSLPVVSLETALSNSRRSRTQELARLFDGIVA